MSLLHTAPQGSPVLHKGGNHWLQICSRKIQNSLATLLGSLQLSTELIKLTSTSNKGALGSLRRRTCEGFGSSHNHQSKCFTSTLLCCMSKAPLQAASCCTAPRWCCSCHRLSLHVLNVAPCFTASTPSPEVLSRLCAEMTRDGRDALLGLHKQLRRTMHCQGSVHMVA